MDISSGWTVLAYLDGNGELEPEISAAYSELKTAAINENIKVLIEIGRLDYSSVKILRPDITRDKNVWSGVRRYQLDKGKETLMENLGNTNMSNPKTLYDFIIWGLQNTYTEHVILVLGGHACEYIGLLNDYSGEYPTVMGIPEFAAALNMASNASSHTIDILIMDACYCNNIETLYELGYGARPTVKTIITHRGNADARGISFKELLSSVEKNSTASPEELAYIICIELSTSLVARKVNTESLKQIKRLFNRLAKKAVSMDEYKWINPSDLLSPKDDDYMFDEAKKIANIVSSLNIVQKAKSNNLSKDISVLDKFIPNKGLAALYYRLAFARDNSWTYLLCSQLQEKEMKFAIAIGFSPLAISEGKVKALIESCNPNLEPDDIEAIFKRLIKKRGWDKRLFPNLFN